MIKVCCHLWVDDLRLNTLEKLLSMEEFKMFLERSTGYGVLFEGKYYELADDEPGRISVFEVCESGIEKLVYHLHFIQKKFPL